MEVLNYIGDHESVSVRDVAQHFEKEKGLARTTILTVMERLRKKVFSFANKKRVSFTTLQKWKKKNFFIVKFPTLFKKL